MQRQQENSSQNSPFQGYTVKELRVLARNYKIKYYYRLRKVDLIDALTKFIPNLYHNLDTIFPFKLDLFSIKNKTKKKTKTKKLDLNSNKLTNIFPFKANLFIKNKKSRKVPNWLSKYLKEPMEPKKNQHKKLDNMQKTTGNENIDLSTTDNFLVTAASSLQNDSPIHSGGFWIRISTRITTRSN